ncbi:MAG TPA: hypothetical protein EYG03_30820 [Planctomycetes bacterium]|nr:hypothetical protein [Fuerstiella sp.]HIK96357.1 hypothetical protein [Planctomycetota bacterium]
MTRISLLLVAFVCFTFAGCGGEPGSGNLDAPDPATDTTPIEDDLASSGMEGMTDAEYLSGGKAKEE